MSDHPSTVKIQPAWLIYDEERKKINIFSGLVKSPVLFTQSGSLHLSFQVNGTNNNKNLNSRNMEALAGCFT